jgi:hypothetical protein
MRNSNMKEFFVFDHGKVEKIDRYGNQFVEVLLFSLWKFLEPYPGTFIKMLTSRH